MNIFRWIEDGKRTQAGPIVAPENFVLEKEIILTGVDKSGDPDEATILHAGKEFFTLDEAEALQEQGYFPEGWRLPTVTEAGAWLTEFTGKNLVNPSGKIMAQLGLKLDGYIYPSMRIYKMIEGRFWLINDDGTNNYTYSLVVYMTKKPEIRTFNRSCGHSIRLVHD